MLKKIKEFFRNLFKINEQKYIEAPKEEIKPISEIQKENDFRTQVAVTSEEEKRILKLQKDFKEGLIKEEDLSKEDYDSLVNLYKSQIEKTKQSIEEYKNKIIAIKSKLVQNS